MAQNGHSGILDQISQIAPKSPFIAHFVTVRDGNLARFALAIRVEMLEDQ